MNLIKRFISRKGLGITLANNKIKDIMKLIRPLENRGRLLKETFRKIINQEGRSLNLLRSWMTTGLQLMKSELTPLAKSVLKQLGL